MTCSGRSLGRLLGEKVPLLALAAASSAVTLLAQRKTLASIDYLPVPIRLANAESAEISAITDYQISQIDIAFATGTLLGASRVHWSPIAAPSIDR